VYQVAADLQGAGIVSVPLKEDFSIDVSGIVDAWKPGIKLAFICSPNNPTGTLVPLEQITALCTQLSNRAIVVVDEAYIEFANAPSATTLLEKYSNLIVLRTLSKAWGLAGARCGVGIGNKPLIDLLQKVRAPYPLTTPAIDLIQECLSDAGETRCKEVVTEINQERAFLKESLLALPEVESIAPSSANFLLVKTTDAQAIFSRAKERGIIIRDRSTQHNLANCVRISIGTREQNESLLIALRQEGSPL
jgi:histidinol-phosphate aminotransferase